MRHAFPLFTSAGLALAGCSPGISAQATVTTIDRTCTIVTTEKSQVPIPGSSETREVTSKVGQSKGECKSVEEWEEVRKKRNKDVDGVAVVHVEYRAPQDGKLHQGTLEFDGRDDEFYQLRAGDPIEVRVSKDDPDRIRPA